MNRQNRSAHAFACVIIVCAMSLAACSSSSNGDVPFTKIAGNFDAVTPPSKLPMEL